MALRPTRARNSGAAETAAAGRGAQTVDRAATGTLTVRAIEDNQAGDGVLVEGQQHLLRNARVAVLDANRTPVRVEPTVDPDGTQVWALPPQTYYIQPQSLAGYTTPTRYHTMEDGG